MEDIVEREPDAAAGQRRSRAPGRVASRLARHARPAGIRLRAALSLRHVRATHPRRPPGRDARRLAAAPCNPWELERQEIRYPIGLAGRVIPDGPAAAGCRAKACMRTPSTSSCQVTARVAWPCCACGRPRHPADRLHRLLPAGLSHGRRGQAAAEVINWVLYPDDSLNLLCITLHLGFAF